VKSKKNTVIKWTNQADTYLALKDAKAYVINALAGDDKIAVVNEADNKINGGDGNDTITVNGNGANNVHGGEGDNLIQVGNGNNKINAQDGSDTITAGTGNNSINAGDGHNTISAGIAGAGQNKINTGSGNDTITTGDGQDQINAGDGLNVIHAGGGNNRVNTGAAKDVITTLGGDDDIQAGEGDNIVEAGDGTNKIMTGAGSDTIASGAGDDEIHAGSGSNVIDAGGGHNRVFTGGGTDTVVTGSGNDTLSTGEGNDTVVLGGGSDVADLSGGNDTAVLALADYAGTERIVLRGGAGSDTLVIKLSAEEAADAKTMEALAGYRAFLAGGGTGEYAFADLDLRVSDFERLEIVKPAVNSPPTSVGLSNAAVNENAAGAVVGVLTGVDLDEGDRLSFAVDDAGSPFEAVQADGVWSLKLKAGVSLDREAGGAVSVAVKATDAGGLSKTGTFTVNVTDVNEGPTGIVVTNQVALAENTSSKTFIADLAVQDPDLAVAFTNNRVGVSDDRFEVDGGKLYLRAGQSFDFEALAESKVSLTLTATDAINPALTASRSLDVAVADVNEAPTAIRLTQLAVTAAENGGAMKVADISITDDRLGTETLGLMGTDVGSYEIREGATGPELWFKGGADFESAKKVYSVAVTATDNLGRSVTSEPLSLDVTNVNEAPTGLRAQSSGVEENAPAWSTIVELSAFDPDGNSTLDDAFTYELVAGPDGAGADNDLVAVVTVNGLKTICVKPGAVIDYDTNPVLNLNVKVTDEGGLSFTKAVTVAVRNVNEAPTSLTLTGTGLNEGAAAGTVVGTLEASDPDAGSSFRYRLVAGADGVDADNDLVVLDGSAIKVATGAVIDYETNPVLNLNVEVMDNTGLMFTKALTVDVADLPEAGTGDVEGNSGSSDPSIPAGGQYVAGQSDAGHALSGDMNGMGTVFTADWSLL
jgi:Ca2+-binding RTX toxin-like protein